MNVYRHNNDGTIAHYFARCPREGLDKHMSFKQPCPVTRKPIRCTKTREPHLPMLEIRVLSKQNQTSKTNNTTTKSTHNENMIMFWNKDISQQCDKPSSGKTTRPDTNVAGSFESSVAKMSGKHRSAATTHRCNTQKQTHVRRTCWGHQQIASSLCTLWPRVGIHI